MAAVTSPARHAASLATSASNRERRQSKVHRAMEWPKPLSVRSSVTTSASVRARMHRPSSTSYQLGLITTTRFTPTRHSDIVHPVSSSQLTEVRDRVRSFGGYNIPIVSPILVDPVGFGFARSHARPGGNVTGVLLTVEDLPSKQLALAVEIVPNARKVGLLVNPGNPTHEPQRTNVEAATAALGIELVTLQARMPDDLHAAFDKLTREKVAMVLAFPDGMFLNERKRIALLAMAARLPSMFGLRQNVEDGGLMSYGIDLRESWRRTAAFVSKILKGAKPGDLPMEFPTKLELVINLTAARVLGLTVPPTLLARADEVIE